MNLFGSGPGSQVNLNIKILNFSGKSAPLRVWNVTLIM